MSSKPEPEPAEEVISIMTPSPSSGISHWKHQQQNHHVRQASVRSRASQPMPEHSELDKRFAKVLVSFFFQFINQIFLILLPSVLATLFHNMCNLRLLYLSYTKTPIT